MVKNIKKEIYKEAENSASCKINYLRGKKNYFKKEGYINLVKNIFNLKNENITDDYILHLAEFSEAYYLILTNIIDNLTDHKKELEKLKK